jgi:CheY-like chemotaxis protein/tetratricopeptide (TPR) repeat protein
VARTILCIDDDRSTSEALGAALDAADYRILHTADPEQGFVLVREEEPELVLLEILLQQGDGLELIERIRTEGCDACDVPIVVVTSGERTPQLYGRAIELGVLEFITKPVLDSQLLEAVREFVSKPRTGVTTRPGEAAPNDAEPLSHTGDLARLSFPELLHRLHADGASGVLILDSGKGRVALQLRNGSPVAVSGGRQREPLEDYLRRCGKISTEQHERVSEQLAFGIGSPREVLLGMGLLSEDEIESASGAQAEERLLELFGHRQGKYRFQPGKRLKADTALECRTSVGSLIVRGILDHTPYGEIRRALEDRAELYVEEAAKPIYALDELELSGAQRKLVFKAQGDRRLCELLGDSEPKQRLLYAFVVLGILELNIDPVLILVEEVSDTSSGALGAEQPHSGAKPPRRTPDLPSATTKPAPEEPNATSWMVELEATLTGLAARFSGNDDFNVLGVAEDATDVEVRDAYQDWIDRIPFDSVPKDATTLRELADKVRRRIERAYQNLANADARERYISLQREQHKRREANETASRALEAESWFRKGEGLLKTKKYDEALEAFGMAAHLDPEEGEYLSHLGWTLYLSNPNETLVQKEALENIAKGIKLSPEREQSYVYLGRIFKATGELAMARKMFKRAIKLRPDCHPALQELRLLEIRSKKQEKPKRLFGRRRGG